MRLYKITATADGGDFTGPKETKWVGTQAEAAAARKHYNSTLGIKRENITTEEVDVPTNKAGLLEFLNQMG